MPKSSPDVPVVPRRKRRLRLLFTILILLAVLIALAPSALSGVVRSQLGRRMTEQLGTPCRIDGLSLGWLSGFEFGEIEIGNAPGFDASHPLLRIQSGRGQVALLHMLRGRFDIAATVRGMKVWVDENAAGETNVARTLAAGGVSMNDSGPDTHRSDDRQRDRSGTGSPDADLLARLSLDLTLRDSGIEIRRAGELIETVSGLDVSIQKDEGDGRFRATLDATLPTIASTAAPAANPRSGAVHFDADFDGIAGSANGTLRASRFDLSRYAPLLRAMLAPDDLTALAGVVDGDVTFRFDPKANPRLQATGDLTVAAPHVAGALLRGMELRAESWTLKPSIAMHGTDGIADTVAIAGTHIDLGFLQIDGLDAPTAGGALAGFAVDLQALARLGGPFADLPHLGGRVTGTVTLPKELLTATTADQAMEALRSLRGIAVDAHLSNGSYSGGGFALAGGAVAFTLQDGKVAIASETGTTLNAGPLELRMAVDATPDTSMPFDLTLAWRGGKVAGDGAHLLRYAVPVLAGLGGQAGDFASSVDMQLSLKGPTSKAAGETWLQWLDHFEGSGDIALKDGSVAPAASLHGLLDLLGQQQRLSIEHLAGAFTMRQGMIATKAMRWVSKGKEYGLTGSAHLDGKLDFGLDVTALLQQHRDGRVIAAFLGDKPLLAGLAGTLDKPTLGVPDLGKMAVDALKQAPRQLLEQQGQDLLKQGLDRLFQKSKKK